MTDMELQLANVLLSSGEQQGEVSIAYWLVKNSSNPPSMLPTHLHGDRPLLTRLTWYKAVLHTCFLSVHHPVDIMT